MYLIVPRTQTSLKNRTHVVRTQPLCKPRLCSRPHPHVRLQHLQRTRVRTQLHLPAYMLPSSLLALCSEADLVRCIYML